MVSTIVMVVMETLWTSIENVSNTFWSSMETLLSANVSSLWFNEAYSQWDQIVYFIEAVSNTPILPSLPYSAVYVRWTGQSHGS